MTDQPTFEFMTDARHDLERDKALLVPLNRPVLLGSDPRDADLIFRRMADNCIGQIRPRVTENVVNGERQYVWSATHLTHAPDGDFIGYVVESSATTVSSNRLGPKFEYHSVLDLAKTMDEMKVFVLADQR